MGFRFIQEGSQEQRKFEALKEEKLREETKRWRNITHASGSKTEEEFIDRFHELASQGRGHPPSQARSIEESIIKTAANIAKVQGNLEIDKAVALLDPQTKAN